MARTRTMQPCCKVGTTLKMGYSGYNGSIYQIGYASAVNLDRKIFVPVVMK